MKIKTYVVMAVATLSLLMAGCKEQKAPIKVCIFPGDYPDPTILRDGNDYYMTHSNFTYYPGLLIWHSTDLLHWEPIARAVQGHDYSIYAPDLCKVNGKYCIKGTTGMDMHNSISWSYTDGRIANIQSSALCLCGRIGQICGTEGYLLVDNINCPQSITVYNDYKPVAHFDKPAGQITGYEYQVLACKEALQNGRLESPYMPHQETLEIMKIMDRLRKQWGVVYPMD